MKDRNIVKIIFNSDIEIDPKSMGIPHVEKTWGKGDRSLGDVGYLHQSNGFSISSRLTDSHSVEEQIFDLHSLLFGNIEKINEFNNHGSIQLKIVIYTSKANFGFQLDSASLKFACSVQAVLDVDIYACD